jgi:hypothetical protein
MREIANVRQVSGEARRRWFSSAVLDLIVWLDDQDMPIGFQLCYDKGGRERALTWSQQHGFSYMAVDDGEQSFDMGYKATPILVPCGAADIMMVRTIFKENAQQLPADIMEFVQQRVNS